MDGRTEKEDTDLPHFEAHELAPRCTSCEFLTMQNMNLTRNNMYLRMSLKCAPVSFLTLSLLALLAAGPAAAAASSIWPAAVPGTVDGGPDSAVELGVKFQSDVMRLYYFVDAARIIILA